MLEIRIRPGEASTKNIRLQQRLWALFSRSAAMGALNTERVTRFDVASVKQLIDELQGWKPLRSATVDLAPLLGNNPEDLDPKTAEQMEAELERLVEALDDSPSPSTEWATMREIFADPGLSGLIGLAEPSLRRYARGKRETPQLIAERLHWLAMVVADLAGAYNALGMRRWFERPRAQLGSKSPRQILGDDWRANDDAAGRVRALAAALSGAQPRAG